LSLTTVVSFAQDQKVADSLALIYKQKNIADTSRLRLLFELSYNEINNLSLALEYSEEMIGLAQELGNNSYLRSGYFIKGTKLRLLGNLRGALDAFYRSAELANQDQKPKPAAEAYSAIADVYSVAKNHANASLYYNKAIHAFRQTNDSVNLASTLFNSADELRKRDKVDSALMYFTESKTIFDQQNHAVGKAYSLGGIGMIYEETGQYEDAETNLKQAIVILERERDYYPVCDYLNSLTRVYSKVNDRQNALICANKSYTLATRYGLKEQIADASMNLSELYEKEEKPEEALRYYKKHITYRDSLTNLKTVQDLADLRTNFEIDQKQREVNLLNEQKRTQKNLNISLAAILVLAAALATILWLNNRAREKAYKLLEIQEQQTEAQKNKAEAALNELKLTQTQLIQSEKMASLGELTAGIAHEIQNPLNFVNNFSELSYELLDELRDATTNKLSQADKAEVEEIIGVLSDNLKKIIEHGRRSDSIVKSMLQHSATGGGNKEIVDINALADQYVRLSYHGMRAKDKSFKATFSFAPGEDVGSIKVLPQEIGRVLLNICNNAFYSVNEKKKQEGDSYEPQVLVSTGKEGTKVFIRVKDNGMGIPATIIDKIFQPFFTTKPTGRGTGLGLSLTYDIVTKGHNGEILVNSKEGEGSEFIVKLPAV
jgi:two-component system, NtrC family, sensor kinase